MLIITFRNISNFRTISFTFIYDKHNNWCMAGGVVNFVYESGRLVARDLSKALHKRGITQARHYTSEALHKQGITQARHYTSEALHKQGITQARHYTSKALHKRGITQARHYTSEALHKQGITQARHYTSKALHKRGITQARHDTQRLKITSFVVLSNMADVLTYCFEKPLLSYFNLIIVLQDATYSVCYISVGSSTCFGC